MDTSRLYLPIRALLNCGSVLAIENLSNIPVLTSQHRFETNGQLTLTGTSCVVPSAVPMEVSSDQCQIKESAQKPATSESTSWPTWVSRTSAHILLGQPVARFTSTHILLGPKTCLSNAGISVTRPQFQNSCLLQNSKLN